VLFPPKHINNLTISIKKPDGKLFKMAPKKIRKRVSFNIVKIKKNKGHKNVDKNVDKNEKNEFYNNDKNENYDNQDNDSEDNDSEDNDSEYTDSEYTDSENNYKNDNNYGNKEHYNNNNGEIKYNPDPTEPIKSLEEILDNINNDNDNYRNDGDDEDEDEYHPITFIFEITYKKE